MGKGLFIVGSDTDVGKTFVTAGMTYIMKKNRINVIPYKPVQSGGEFEDGSLIAPDIRFTKDIAGLSESYETMNTYCFKDAVSPHIAAERESDEVHSEKVINAYNDLTDCYDYVLVEGAGGVIVPLSRDYYLYELIKDLDIPVLIVTRSGVGTINHTSLTVEFLKKQGIEIKGIVMNSYTDTYYEQDNHKILTQTTGIRNIITLNRVDSDDKQAIKNNYEKCFEADWLIELFG